jgi:uncharacterized membrane protein
MPGRPSPPGNREKSTFPDMTERPLTFEAIADALDAGWRTANATRAVSIAYAGVFTIIGAVIIGALLATGRTPFVITAAGAFMLVGPAILAGFFAVARKVGADGTADLATVRDGFAEASVAVWVIAMVCALLFMIFITDVAILYSYMIGGKPIFPVDMIPVAAKVASFVFWGLVSGAVIALLLFAISAFSVPLLCDRRADLVGAVVTSVRIVFGNFTAALSWALLLAASTIGSILLLPLFPLVLPVMAYASYALYKAVLPDPD